MSPILPFLLLLAPPQSSAALAPTAAAAARDGEVRYIVKPGDTLFNLAARYFVRQSDYRAVQALNHVADPYRLSIGKPLRIPRRLLRTEPVRGAVVAFRGSVSILAGGRSGVAAIGSVVNEGAVLATAAGAFVTVELPDGSRFSLPSASRVSVDRLRRTILTREVERAFDLKAGRSEWQITPAKSSGDTFHVTTPVATAAVRGTGFRVTYEDALSTFGVVEGKVAVADATPVPGELVPAGRGIAVRPESRSPQVQLAPAPEIIRPGAVQKADAVSFRARPVPGATHYAFELATDAGFVDRIAERITPAPEARFDAVPNGTYFLRASVTDANGIQGLADTFSFDRRLNRVSLDDPAAGGFGGRKAYRFRWQGGGEGEAQYRFILARDPAALDRVIDQAGLSVQDISVTDLRPGTYYWQVWSIRFEKGRSVETVTPPQKLQIGSGA